MSDIIVPNIKRVEIYIDDTADRSLGIEGFTMLACDDYSAYEIRRGIKECFKSHEIEFLHLSRLKKRGEKLKRLLRDVLGVIVKEVARSNFGYFRFMISPEQVVRDATNGLMELAGNILEKIRDRPISDSTKRLIAYVGVPAIEVVSRIQCAHGLPVTITIENKHGSGTDSHKKCLVGISFDEARNHLKTLLRVYLKQVHKIDCRIDDILVIKTDAHPTVGAIDAIGNLCLNHVRSILFEKSGQTVTRLMQTKCDIFVQLLTDIIGKEQLSNSRERINSAFSVENNRLVPLEPSHSITVFEMWRSDIAETV